ncbi:MAG: hypothetical protein HZA93_01155 [Verrucomicrobia bacterium]|nr:hypothetical protein [Verrucomicrobiota bacterium]
MWLKFWIVLASVVSFARAATLPTLDEALAAKRDVWGEAAMAQPNGASYEFFAPLLPPPRYVNADFRHYPIVLSAPNAKAKARLISNGSGVNLRGGARSWHDVGVPFTFRVGPDELVFGTFPARTAEPTLAEGWLPIAEIRYEHTSPIQSEGAVPLTQRRPQRKDGAEIYRLEAFASTDPALAENGVVFVKFSLAQGATGTLTVSVDQEAPLTFSEGKLKNQAGGLVALADVNWKWDRRRLQAKLTAKNSATLAIATKPLQPEALPAVDYDAQRASCVATWRQLIAAGMNVEIPEPRVNAAWRALIAQNNSLISGDRLLYSAGNQYEQLYEAEGSDAALAFLGWGHTRDTLRVLPPLLDFTRKGLEHHQAGFKIADVCRYYWQTRDAEAVRALRPRWEKEARLLADTRTGPHGLYPAGRYAGDISTPAQAIGANANGWRALRDLSAVLAAIGESAEAARYAAVAREFRATVLDAIARSTRRDTTPPFIPSALLSDEPVHDPIIHSRIGSYWNIIIGYTIGSGIFPPGRAEENWLPHYQEQHGGIFLGMVRSGGDEFNFWTGSERVNPLYGTRYTLDVLRRDEPERALVSFYGMLAQGFTRNTFIAGEGCSLTPVDERGRIFYCPPNTAGNAHFLSMLRALLVQDPDLDDDGQPETLRLLFATPKRWLEDGKVIAIDRAPTAFGEVALRVESKLAAGEIVADVTLPARNAPRQTLLRLRVPDGWRVTGVTVGSTNLPVDDRGTVDLSTLRGRISLRATVAKQ